MAEANSHEPKVRADNMIQSELYDASPNAPIIPIGPTKGR
jgi:hypothetical protein